MSYLSRIGCAIKSLPKIENLRKELPDPVWSLPNRNTWHHRILKKAHESDWILKYKLDDSDVKEIRRDLLRWYGEKTDGYKEEVSFEGYSHQFSLCMGELEEDSNNKEIHLLNRFPIREGHEFRKIHIFGRDPLDEFTTLLINAISSYYYLDENDDAEHEIPHVVTRKLT